MVQHQTILVGTVVGTAWLATASLSEAQERPTDSPSAFRIPSVMISAGLGSANDPRGAGFSNVKPMQTVSVQFLPARHLVVEAEFGRWETTWDHRVPYRPRGEANGEQIEAGALEGWSGGVNLFYRTEPRRVSAFVGGGPFLGSERYADSFRLEGCVPTVRDECWRPNQYEYRETSLRFQAVTGADVQLAGPLRAYGSLQFTTMDHACTSVGPAAFASSRPVAPLRRGPQGPSRQCRALCRRLNFSGSSAAGRCASPSRMAFARRCGSSQSTPQDLLPKGADRTSCTRWIESRRSKRSTTRRAARRSWRYRGIRRRIPRVMRRRR